MLIQGMDINPYHEPVFHITPELAKAFNLKWGLWTTRYKRTRDKWYLPKRIYAVELFGPCFCSECNKWAENHPEWRLMIMHSVVRYDGRS